MSAFPQLQEALQMWLEMVLLDAWQESSYGEDRHIEIEKQFKAHSINGKSIYKELSNHF